MPAFRFIHSPDLHLGRRFSTYPEDIRGRLVEARHLAIEALAAAAKDHEAGDILIAGLGEFFGRHKIGNWGSHGHNVRTRMYWSQNVGRQSCRPIRKH